MSYVLVVDDIEIEENFMGYFTYTVITSDLIQNHRQGGVSIDVNF